MEMNDPRILQGLVVVSFVLIVLSGYLFIKLKGLSKKYEFLMKDSENKSLQEMLIKRLEQINITEQNVYSLEDKVCKLRRQVQGCTQRVGIVRFNAYNDIAGDLSYAIAILDEQGDGVVLSGLTSRHDARSYAKPIAKGISECSLAEEEKRAIALAKNRYV